MARNFRIQEFRWRDGEKTYTVVPLGYEDTPNAPSFLVREIIPGEPDYKLRYEKLEAALELIKTQCYQGNGILGDEPYLTACKALENKE